MFMLRSIVDLQNSKICCLFVYLENIWILKQIIVNHIIYIYISKIYYTLYREKILYILNHFFSFYLVSFAFSFILKPKN